jgi:hypothetical protein
MPPEVTSLSDELVPRWFELSIELQQRLGSGAPLEAATRVAFERRLGVDLGSVRVHATPLAGLIAERVGARAFSVARRVFAPPARLEPSSSDTGALLGHELTHVAHALSPSSTAGAGSAPVQRSPVDDGDASEALARQVEQSLAVERRPARRGRRPSSALVAERVYQRLLDELQSDLVSLAARTPLDLWGVDDGR